MVPCFVLVMPTPGVPPGGAKERDDDGKWEGGWMVVERKQGSSRDRKGGLRG